MLNRMQQTYKFISHSEQEANR